MVPALLGVARGDLSGVDLEFDPRAAVGVVLAAEGYPGTVREGDPISGLEGPFEEGVQVFQAGTSSAPDGRIVTAGGRVLAVCALGHGLDEAAARAYAAVGRIRVPRDAVPKGHREEAMTKPLVLILMGSDSDWDVMSEARKALDDLGVTSEVHVSSAHRTPARTGQLAREAAGRGIEVVICGAGAAAHLAGVCAAETELPVLGVPLASSDLAGLDALLSMAQMPAGVPVGTLAIGKAGARNAGLLAARIVAQAHPEVRERVRAQRERMAKEVEEKDSRLQAKLAAPKR